LANGASKFLGNITTNGQVRSDFGTYWNQITAENECKWGSIEGREGTYNFTGCKNAYNWAKNNKGYFKFHALVWGSQYPSWLESKDQAGTLSAITKWFDAVKKEFPDLEQIDVVNEAIRTGNNQYHSNYPKTKIIQALGGDNNGDYKFVTTAFKMARERWPKAILIYNDYNTFRWQINEGIDLIKRIKAAGAPVDAYYHSTSGGRTADIVDVWPHKEARPYLRGVVDTAPDGRAWSGGSNSSEWTESWDGQALRAAVRTDLSEAVGRKVDPGEVKSLRLEGRDSSGRASKLVVEGTLAVVEVPSDRIRWALRRPAKGRPILRSSRFELREQNGRYHAVGTGNGHGVGMSQNGAMGRAWAGHTYAQILSAYYPGTQLRNLEP